jgi:hypothetical protein
VSRSLRKRDVERLLTDYDADPVGSVLQALTQLIDPSPASWPEAVAALDVDPDRRMALLAGDVAALDWLAQTLNETRQAPHPTTG